MFFRTFDRGTHGLTMPKRQATLHGRCVPQEVALSAVNKQPRVKTKRFQLSNKD
jgi:hypothetical protein